MCNFFKSGLWWAWNHPNANDPTVIMFEQTWIFMVDRYFKITDRKIRNHMGKIRCWFLSQTNILYVHMDISQTIRKRTNRGIQIIKMLAHQWIFTKFIDNYWWYNISSNSFYQIVTELSNSIWNIHVWDKTIDDFFTDD